MDFVSVVSPTTTVWGSFVGAVVVGGGGGASSVVLQSIVGRGIIFSFLCSSYSVPGLSSSIGSRHIRHRETPESFKCTCVRTEESNRMNTHTCMSCTKQDTGISHT